MKQHTIATYFATVKDITYKKTNYLGTLVNGTN